MVLCVGAQETKPYLVKSYSGVKRLLVGTSGGNISVSGENGNNTKVEVIIRSSNYNDKISAEEIERRLAGDYELVMEMKGDRLELSAKPKRKMNWKDGLSISFHVTAPRTTACELATSGGNIVMRNLEGRQDFSTSGGNLVLEDLKGVLKGRTSGGNIVAEGLSDDIDLATSGGNVSAEHCKGKIVLATSGGNVSLEDLEGSIDATTSGGNVSAENLRGVIEAGTSGGNVTMDKIRGSLKAGTSGGSLRVIMDEVAGYVQLTNSGGRIDVDLPSGKGYDLDVKGSKVNTSSLSNYSGTVTEGRLNGKINGGGKEIKVVNSGTVNLSFH